MSRFFASGGQRIGHKVGYFIPGEWSQSHRQGDQGKMSPEMRECLAWARGKAGGFAI